MQAFSTCLFFLSVLFVLFHTGSCHKCFYCTGVDVPGVHENQEPTPGVPHTPACVYVDADHTSVPTLDCTGDCVKAVVVSGGATLVMRGCSVPQQCKDGTGECYSCTGHLCNSSTYAVSSLTLISILSLAFLKWNL